MSSHSILRVPVASVLNDSFPRSSFFSSPTNLFPLAKVTRSVSARHVSAKPAKIKIMVISTRGFKMRKIRTIKQSDNELAIVLCARASMPSMINQKAIKRTFLSRGVNCVVEAFDAV